MKESHSSLDWLSPRLLIGLMAGVFLAASFAPPLPLYAETPPEPDDYVIVSDEGDVAPAADAEEADVAAEGEPAELPTVADPQNVTAKAAATDADASTDSADGQDAAAVPADATKQAPVAEVAPVGKPTPALPTALEPAASEPAPVKPDERMPESAGNADDELNAIRPAVRGKPSATVEAEAPPATPAEVSPTAAGDSTPRQTARMAPEGASFRGILPGETTVEELKAAWGPAKEIRNAETGAQYIYHSKPFKQVVVTVIDEKVDTILIRLEKEFEPPVLARQLLLDDVEPATIYNARGQMLGMAFPERGVLFGFVAGVPVQVGQIVLEPINSQPFVTRAEKNVRRDPANALADAEYALNIDGDYDRAHAIHARVLMQLGAYESALAAIDKALALQPAEADFQLTRALIQFRLQHYGEAARLAESLATGDDAPPLVAARAEKLRGDLLSCGPERKFDQAIKHHTAAIERAEQISTTSAGPIRRAAKELLVEAHVAVAHDIAWGDWRQKKDVVPRWIDRATSFCDNLIERDFGEECVRLRLLEQTLTAYAGMKEAPDVTAIIDAMTRLARQQSENLTEPRQIEVMQWQLGEALASAMLICHQQGKADTATQIGQQALVCFEKAGKFCSVCPESDFLIGRIYYRLGAIQAVEHDDHTKAIVWYDESIPLLERPMPLSVRPEVGQAGELFVSMAVSYWEKERQDEAIRLTKQGANLMETAVRQFNFPPEALAVPYGNLASMHAGIGQSAEAKRFADLAAQAETRRR